MEAHNIQIPMHVERIKKQYCSDVDQAGNVSEILADQISLGWQCALAELIRVLHMHLYCRQIILGTKLY